jgi:hypothetical protein
MKERLRKGLEVEDSYDRWANKVNQISALLFLGFSIFDSKNTFKV